MTRVLIADDHALTRELLRREFRRARLDVVGEAENRAQAVALCGKLQPDVVTIDLNPFIDSAEAGRSIHDRFPFTRVIVMMPRNDQSHRATATRAGASVCISTADTSLSDLILTIRRSPAVAETFVEIDGTLELTGRQLEILQMFAAGYSTKRVATSLGVSQKTIHNNLGSVYRTLDVQNLPQAVFKAIRHGLIRLEGSVPPQREGGAET